MPLVFASNEVSLSGPGYDDRTGVSYEYPRRYAKLILPGERFVYYRGRRRHSGTARQEYFGTGVVGNVRSSSNGLLECEILDYTPFQEAIFFKHFNGTYFETGARTRSNYFRDGVRVISEEDFESITSATPSSLTLAVHDVGPFVAALEGGYANPETARAVERYSVDQAINYLRVDRPGSRVLEMARNNPGFDLLVEFSSGSKIFVEVKGTQRAEPHFFLSEGERRFAEENAERYLLIMVYSIDLVHNKHSLMTREGALLAGRELTVMQWRGRLDSSSQ